MPRPPDLLITAPGQRFLQHHLSIAAGTAQSHTVPTSLLSGVGPGGLARFGQQWPATPQLRVRRCPTDGDDLSVLLLEHRVADAVVMYPAPIPAAIALAYTESAGYSCSETDFTLG